MSRASSETSPPSFSPERLPEKDLAEVLLKLVATETGVSLNELTESASFADLGVDSMMSVAIITAFKRDTGNELPASFFTKYSTVSDVREELGIETLGIAHTQSAPILARSAISVADQKTTSPAPAAVSQKVSNILLALVARETGV